MVHMRSATRRHDGVPVKFSLDKAQAFRYTTLCQRSTRGGIAQLGERLHGMQEVRGSIPLVSTILKMNGCESRISHPFLSRGAVSFNSRKMTIK